MVSTPLESSCLLGLILFCYSLPVFSLLVDSKYEEMNIKWGGNIASGNEYEMGRKCNIVES